MAKNNNLQDFLTDVANSIRTKTQTTDLINAQDFSDKILSIQTGGENTLKKLLDATKSTQYLFYRYKGTSVDDLISYNDTENVTTMKYMFYDCTKLTSIPLLNTSKVADMNHMFYACISLTTMPQLDTINATDMSYLFAECRKLTSIPLLNTSKVTTMNNMFNSCYALTNIPLLDTRNVTDMSYMFSLCSELTEIPAFDVSKVNDFSVIFNGCSSLNAIHMTGMKVSFSISSSTKFTTEALHEIITNLATVTSTQELKMGSTNLAKVSEEYVTIATNKGWTLA